MNHQKVYNSIIENAKIKNRKKLKKDNIEYYYYEKHHIIPRCLNGTDDKENKVLLTAKEHFLCHKLLMYIYKGNISLMYAFFMMAQFQKYKKFISSKDYENIKILISKTSRPIVSQEIREKMSESRKGISPWNKGQKDCFTEESRKKISKANKGKHQFSEESKKKMSDFKKGKPVGKGRKLALEHIENIRKCRLGTIPGNNENIRKCRLGTIPGNKEKIAVTKNGNKYFILQDDLEKYLQDGYITNLSCFVKLIKCPHCNREIGGLGN